jgi:cytochrome P450
MNAATPLDIDLSDLEQLRDPALLQRLAQIRSHAPVQWSERMQGWLVTGHSEVWAAFRERRILNNRVPRFAFRSIPREEWPSTIPNLTGSVSRWVVNMDGDEHRRVRSVFQDAFMRSNLDRLVPSIERLVQESVEKAESLGTFDFMSEIAYPVPAKLIFELLGIPLDNLPRLWDWNRRVSETVQTIATRETLLDGDAALAELNSMLLRQVEDRRAYPRDDFLGVLTRLVDDGSGVLSLEELLAICQILLFAGQDTTVNSMCLGLIALLRHPEQQELFLRGEVPAIDAMTELTRYSAMSNCMFKLAGEDFELGGKQIREGDILYLMISAANHDPIVFPNPERLDFRRANLTKVVTFAPGIHMCIGHYLARLELSIFFKAFLTRFRKIEVLDEPIRFQPNFPFRGLEHLHVRVAREA